MADRNVVEKVLTTPTFINGSLHPAGVPVYVDLDQIEIEEPSKEKPKGNTPNLADPGSAARLIVSPVAPIAPTGPNPTMPQQIPPGAMQTTDGYAMGASLLVAEGSERARLAEEEGIDDGSDYEEEDIQRLESVGQGAGTAGSGVTGNNGTENDGSKASASTESASTFDSEAFIGRTLDEISDDEIDALSDEDRAAVIAAEKDREKPRTGLLSRLGVTE